jgi:hypothetical protein
MYTGAIINDVELEYSGSFDQLTYKKNGETLRVKDVPAYYNSELLYKEAVKVASFLNVDISQIVMK